MKQIIAAIITIGDELLIGQTIDTNSAWMGRELNRAGIWVRRKAAVADKREDILEALQNESSAADVIFITGGLGSTGDDITKSVLCEYFGASLTENAEVLVNIKTMFTSRGLPLVERNLQQALVPDTCIVLPNDRGTAPGMWFEKAGKIYVSMPGVPHEMQAMMTHSVLPRLNSYFTLPVILHRTLITTGMGESQIAERLTAFEKSLPADIKLAYLPGDGLLKLRLTARGDEQQRTADELEQLFGVLRETLADITIADEDILLEAWVGRLLKKNNLTLSTAESCTGGLIAHKITTIPGSSDYYKGTVVSYSNEIKESLLRVPAEVLYQYGAVSEETVKAMVKGVIKLMKTDLAIAVSGIMGPAGGTPEKPVGTVWIAAGTENNIKTRKYRLRYDRSRNIEITANYALNLLREVI
jgi:nicotinamide-nucleotide amidase